MKSAITSILEKIEKTNIKPKSKWYFAYRNILAWLMTSIGLLVSGFFSAGLIFAISNQVLVSSKMFFIFTVSVLAIVGLSLYMTYRRFMHVKKSHRANLQYVVLLALGIIFIIGFMMAKVRLYARFDHFTGQYAPILSLENRIHHQWSEPQEQNKLAVEVLYIDNDGYVYGEDFGKVLHMIDPLLLPAYQRDLFVNHLWVRMIGYQEDGIFYPDMVQPWEFQYQQDKKHPDYGLPIRKGNINFENL